MADVPSKNEPRSIVSWIITLSLIIAGADILAGSALSLATLGVFIILLVIFVALFFLFAFGSWSGKRWGYLGGIIMSLLIDLLFGNPADISSNPGSYAFPFAFTLFVATVVAILYGAYGFYTAKRPNVIPRQVPRSSILGLVAIGVAIGGLFVGGFAGVTQNRLLSSHGVRADITIPMGAASLTTTAFNPDNFTVTVGTTVTWFNGDSTAHTVTSSTGAFNSGSMASGATYSYTFSQAGKYSYYCEIHPNMVGMVVVTA